MIERTALVPTGRYFTLINDEVVGHVLGHETKEAAESMALCIMDSADEKGEVVPSIKIEQLLTKFRHLTLKTPCPYCLHPYFKIVGPYFYCTNCTSGYSIKDHND